MKTKITLLFFFLTSVSMVYAQRYGNAKNINATGSFLKNGYGVTVGYESLISGSHSIVIDAEYRLIKEKLRMKDTKVHLTDIDLYIGYRRYFQISDTDLHFFIGGGMFLGNENFTNKNDMPSSVVFDRKTGFLFGGAADIGLEYNFTKASIFTLCRPRYEIENKDFTTSFNIGFKYYF